MHHKRFLVDIGTALRQVIRIRVTTNSQVINPISVMQYLLYQFAPNICHPELCARHNAGLIGKDDVGGLQLLRQK